VLGTTELAAAIAALIVDHWQPNPELRIPTRLTPCAAAGELPAKRVVSKRVMFRNFIIFIAFIPFSVRIKQANRRN
jgi:hypothetical protein